MEHVNFVLGKRIFEAQANAGAKPEII